MTLYRLLGYALAITFVFGAMRTVPRAQTELSYDAFAKLSAPERSDYWNATTPQVRSRLAQGHLTAWMTANQRRLSADQISNLKAVIALLTPEFYGNPESPAMIARSAEIERKVMCTLWKSDAVDALRPLGGTRASVTWTDDVFTWLGKCYLGR